MPTVVRDGKFRIVIYTNDHAPAHVHAIFDGYVIKIMIAETSVTLGPNDGSPKRSDTMRVLALVADHLDLCLAEWKEIHG